MVDECTGPAVTRGLRGLGHDVHCVFGSSRGMTDAEVLRQASAEERILITNDKDFGDAVFRDRHSHRGLILLRLEDERSAGKIAALTRLLDSHSARLANTFVVVTEQGVRFAGD
jgi:predicted nuclease of predicted toxin-antitoxin system